MHLQTSRLTIDPIDLDDATFMLELLNTDGWLKFIGDRNVHSIDDASKYIQRIIDNANITYWVVRIGNSGEAIGVISYIKRDYLSHHDIGFAFLPEVGGRGYAFEAASEMMRSLMDNEGCDQLIAITNPDNTKSIKLLEKLGMRYSRMVEMGEQRSVVYEIDGAMF